MENTLTDVDITNIKTNKKVNPQNYKTAWRSDGNKYDNRPNDPDYYKNYFQEHKNDKTICEICGKELLKRSKAKHKKSKKCRLEASNSYL